MSEPMSLIIVFMAFLAVTVAVFILGRYVATELKIQQRVGLPASGSAGALSVSDGAGTIVATYFDEKRFGVTGSVRSKLRRDLMRAGFFHVNAINYYIFARVSLVVLLPTLTYAAIEVAAPGTSRAIKFGLVVITVFLAVLGPDAYIARRQRVLVQNYRRAFPDLLDLLVVCVDAGLSLEAAFERITAEIMKQSSALGMNLLLMGAEMRAGRGTIDALDSLSDRLGLEESRAFVGVLRQSVELGSDIGDALRVFSDEMRDKRLLRAEERANQLPVKMVLPLGLCIFPVILLVVLFPVVVRLMTVMR